VISIYPNAVIQNTVVNYVTIVRIGDRQGKILRPEMTANVTIFLETRENVLAVPRGAIIRDQGEYMVYVQADDQIEKRVVRVGWRDDSYTEILSGLEEGERILIGKP
jgi:macrolide-specific efflux system membrane fusion protein